MSQVRLEFKPSQPKVCGYFLINVSSRIAGTASPSYASVELTGISKGGDQTSIEGKISQEVSEDWKVSLKSKVEQKNLDEIVNAFTKGSGVNPVKRLTAAFGKTLGAEISSKDRAGPAEIDVGGGIELSLTPFFFYSKWSVSKTTSILNTKIKYSATVEGRVYVGLSEAGWWKLVDIVGRDLVRQTLKNAGSSMTRLLTTVSSSAALTATVAIIGGIAVTFGLVAILTVATRNPKWTTEAIELWYVVAYRNKIFNYPRPSGYCGYTQLRDLLIQCGEMDAISDARQTARSLGDRDSHTLPDEIILCKHRARLEKLYKGSESLTKHYLEKELKKTLKIKLGLR